MYSLPEMYTNIRALKAFKYFVVFPKMGTHAIWKRTLANKKGKVAPVCQRSQCFSNSPPIYLLKKKKKQVMAYIVPIIHTICGKGSLLRIQAYQSNAFN